MTVDYKVKYSDNVSERSKSRFLNVFYSFDTPDDIVKHPNPISLGGGTPNEGFFPVEAIHLNIVDEPFQHLSYDKRSVLTNNTDINVKEHVHELTEAFTSSTYRYTENPSSEVSIARGFQYGETDGFPQIKKFARDLIEETNKPAYNDWDVIIANGSGDSLHKMADLFIDEGSTILVEDFTFTPFNNNVENLGGINIPVKINFKNVENEPYFDYGVDVAFLEDLLDNWGTDEAHYKGLSKPKSFYTIPTGQNPTGVTQSQEKRKQIYAICEKHNIIIIEDDPYGYIVLPKHTKDGANPYAAPDFTIEKYKKKFLRPSYLQIDISGRVIRLETFSKLFAPGLRLGFIVANKYLIERIFTHTALSTRQPSGVSQLVFNNIVNKWGGVDGWLKWASKIAKHYTERRDVLIGSLYATDAYKKGLFSLVEPDAGMFVIIFVNFDKIITDPKKWDRAFTQLKYLSMKYGVDVVYGNKMASDINKDFSLEKSNFLRITIAAAANNEQLVEASTRLSDTFTEFFQKLEAGEFDDFLNTEKKE